MLNAVPHGAPALVIFDCDGVLRGLLVNRFRGDPALFTEGVRILERRGGVPVLGVLPHAALGVASEDSLSLGGGGGGASVAGPDTAVVRYPHISNFDELEPLAQAGAVVRYVRDPGALGVPDLVVLPGTKTTIADLEWLRSSGIAARLLALADAGVPVLGICGGFQMLGEDLDDPLDAGQARSRYLQSLVDAVAARGVRVAHGARHWPSRCADLLLVLDWAIARVTQ